MKGFLLLLVIFSLNLGLAASYNLEDLKVLSTEGAYQEFFKHALDIRPAERLTSWKEMVSKMADLGSKNVLAQDVIEKNDFLWIEELFKWPSLKSDDVFKLRRQEIGLKYLKNCLKGTTPCWDELKIFWMADTSVPDIALKLAEMSMDLPSPPYSTWNFLEVALKNPLSEFYCKKDFVMAALWGKLEIDYVRLGSKGDFLTKIDQTIHSDCLPSLNQEARKRLFAPDKLTDRELAFQILSAQGKMTQNLADFFYTVYLLENPSQGELFNYAWNRLSELSKKPNRRDDVLLLIKKLDPLPDYLFTTLDNSKKKAILRHFKSNFPEYMTFYANQCLKFYQGKEIFPQGNPTIHCQDFMNSELAPEFLEKDKIDNFQKTRHI